MIFGLNLFFLFSFYRSRPFALPLIPLHPPLSFLPSAPPTTPFTSMSHHHYIFASITVTTTYALVTYSPREHHSWRELELYVHHTYHMRTHHLIRNCCDATMLAYLWHWSHCTMAQLITAHNSDMDWKHLKLLPMKDPLLYPYVSTFSILFVCDCT